MFRRLERARDRRNPVGDTPTNRNCQNHCCHQLAERVRDLEKEIMPDFRYYQRPSIYSPFSALTPCSNVSGNGFSNYLLSPNSAVPLQRFGFSSKVIEHAHQIPERLDHERIDY